MNFIHHADNLQKSKDSLAEEVTPDVKIFLRLDNADLYKLTKSAKSRKIHGIRGYYKYRGGLSSKQRWVLATWIYDNATNSPLSEEILLAIKASPNIIHKD